MSTLSVVVPTWNNADLTIRCLEALRRHTEADLHIIWIDNGSSADQHAAVRTIIGRFDHDTEYHPQPLGFARATNRGLAYIRGEYTVLLNNDVEVCPEWDIQLRQAVDDAPGAAGPFALGANTGVQGVANHRWLGVPPEVTDPGAIAAFLRDRWRNQVVDIPLHPSHDLAPFRGMLAFFCVLLRTEAVRAVGLLDEGYGWGYCEDDDYCMRLRQAGFSLSLCPASVVCHDAGHTMGLVQDEWKQRLARNIRRFEERWGHRPT